MMYYSSTVTIVTLYCVAMERSAMVVVAGFVSSLCLFLLLLGKKCDEFIIIIRLTEINLYLILRELCRCSRLIFRCLSTPGK